MITVNFTAEVQMNYIKGTSSNTINKQKGYKKRYKYIL